MLNRMTYRFQQFWSAVTAAPARDELEQARLLLGPQLFALFRDMPPAEQAHALNVLRRVQQQGESPPELQCAALLHDVGKSRQPLQVWERALIVLARKTLPGKATQWGRGPASGWRRAFVVAAQHPAWGAELAAQAGAAPLTVRLIRRHQEERVHSPGSLEDRLLRQLQTADDLS